jgi:hypothetical protein
MKYRCDLAISAVPTDAGFVVELVAQLTGRLGTTPSWHRDGTAPVDATAAVLLADHSRVALVLHQHLWRHDERTQHDATVLRERIRRRPKSVCVMALDSTPVPSWLADAPCYDVAALGRAAAAEFVLDAIASAGGSVGGAPVRKDDGIVPEKRWPEPPTPYLSQPRAHSGLRHELDTLIRELKSAIAGCRTVQPAGTFDLRLLPHRLVVQLDDVALSFSWVAGRTPTVTDGRLLVIAWRNVAAGIRGDPALKLAAPIHERTYIAEGNAADDWRWRADDLSGRPYSTTNLAAEWLARVNVERANGVAIPLRLVAEAGARG